MLILNHVGKSYFSYFDGDVRHIQKLLDINFLSYVAMTVSALPMLKQSGGSIVVVSSMAGEWEQGGGHGTAIKHCGLVFVSRKHTEIPGISKEPGLLNTLKVTKNSRSFSHFLSGICSLMQSDCTRLAFRLAL